MRSVALTITALLATSAVAFATIALNLWYSDGIPKLHDIRWHAAWLASYLDNAAYGEIYPRWLASQFEGFGAPVFYYYPPFVTMFTATIRATSLHQLILQELLAASGAAMLLLSIAAFYFFLTQHIQGKTLALRWYRFMCALLYGVAPYHFITNLLNRGAMAEYASYIWVPLVFGGVHFLTTRPGAWAFLLLCVSVAGLLLTHLLTALLIAPVLILYGLMVVWHYHLTPPQRIRALLTLAVAGLAGLGLAACYVLPATLMMHEIHEGALTKVMRHSYLYHALETDKFKQHLMVVAVSLVTMATIFMMMLRCNAASSKRYERRIATMLLCVPLVAFALMMGAAPFVFEPPSPYYKIQFTWRSLGIAEFSLVAGISIAAWRLWQMSRLQPALCLIGLLLSGSIVWQADHATFHYSRAKMTNFSIIDRERISPNEYLAEDAPFKKAEEGLALLRERYGVWSHPVRIIAGDGEIVAASQINSTITAEIRADSAVSILFHQFYFPGWDIKADGGKMPILTADADTHLIRAELEAGLYQLRLSRQVLPLERIGAWISAGSAFVIALIMLWLRRKRSA